MQAFRVETQQSSLGSISEANMSVHVTMFKKSQGRGVGRVAGTMLRELLHPSAAV